MAEEIFEAVSPLLLEALAAVLTLAIGWLSVMAQRKFGIEIEARHREALHSAIMTGVRRSMANDLSREAIVHEALCYVKASVPDAVQFLVKDKGVFHDLVEAKLREVLDSAADLKS